ncbi:diaminopimelate decarboxylase [Gulosibacter hominis]|uniref:diaminopimelate decarboxylase n=1 Tax=Gulosibacter hominis TaxID=2770504 RepID=UPI001E2870B6|nr:diaminopimelate decarboxylase [Gulosibacter hominis]
MSKNELLQVLPETAAFSDEHTLEIGGLPVSDLAAKYGTPLHVIDETGLRQQMRRVLDGLRTRWPKSDVLFASKAFPIRAMYSIAESEGICVDVAGGGELNLALRGGVSPEHIYFHGNAKTEAELRMGLDAGIRCFIIDNFDELARLEKLCDRVQEVMLRVNPLVPVNVHPNQVTAHAESKFGMTFDEARKAIERIKAHPHLRFEGVHLHLGSQILDVEPFAEGVKAVAEFGDVATYDIGGGLGVDYYPGEGAPAVDAYLDAVTGAAVEVLPRESRIIIEPGRALVARSGVTVYSVVSVKRRDRKSFVAVDGGMADQLDIALTGQRYSVTNISRSNPNDIFVADVVGRQCESGDLLVSDAEFQGAEPGDLLVMPVTGAYSYTMTNNYNGALRPAVVLVADGKDYLAVRRENYEELSMLHEPAAGVDWAARAR